MGSKRRYFTKKSKQKKSLKRYKKKSLQKSLHRRKSIKGRKSIEGGDFLDDVYNNLGYCASALINGLCPTGRTRRKLAKEMSDLDDEIVAEKAANDLVTLTEGLKSKIKHQENEMKEEKQIKHKIKQEVIEQLRSVERQTRERNLIRQNVAANKYLEGEKERLILQLEKDRKNKQDETILNRSLAIEKLRQIELDTKSRNLQRRLVRQTQKEKLEEENKRVKLEQQLENERLKLIEEKQKQKLIEEEVHQREIELRLKQEEEKLQLNKSLRLKAVERLRNVEQETKLRNTQRKQNYELEKIKQEQEENRLRILEAASQKYYKKPYKQLSPSSRRYFGNETEKVNQQLLQLGLNQL